jgi:xylulokinase
MYCGIDIGTSAVKCTLVDMDGLIHGTGRAAVGLYHGSGPDVWEADPAEWLKAIAQAYSMASAAPDYHVSQLQAVAISGNGPTLIAVGADGLPIGRASSWLDGSAITEAARLSSLSGMTVDPAFYLPKVMRWLSSPQASLIKRFFSGPEYLAFMLGAAPITYLSDPFYDRHIWMLDSAEQLGLDCRIFPPYIPPAELIGRVSPKAGDAVGLPVGLPIVSAFPDFLAALVGSGTVQPGMACDRTGSSEAINLCATEPFPDRSVFSLPHPINGLWNLSGGLSTSGKALEWFSKVGGYAGSTTLSDEAAQTNPAADGVLFLPYLSGERAPLWDKQLRGAFLGLGLDSGRPSMARAVVESMAFGIRLAADRIRTGGYRIDLLRCSGGAARDKLLCNIKASVLGIPLEVPQLADCEPVGDACACAVALGDHKDLAQASAAMVKIGTVHQPDPELAACYETTYERWKLALNAVAGAGLTVR